MLSGNFKGAEIRHGIFMRLIFIRGICLDLLEALGIFGGLIFAPIRSSPLFEIRSTPPWVQIGSTLHHRLVTARDSTLTKKIWR